MIKKNVLIGLLVYFIFTYLLQLIGYLIGFYNGVWSTSDKFHLLFFDLVIIFFSFLFLELLGFGKILLTSLRKLNGLLYITKRKKSIIFLTFLSSLPFFILNLGNYRYTGTAISESVSITLTLPLVLKQILFLFVFLEFYHKLNLKDAFLGQLEKALIVCSQAFMITGVTSALILAVTLYVFYVNLNRIISLKQVLGAALIPFFFILGLYIKWSPPSLEEFIFSLQKMEAVPYVSYLISRFSTTYYAHMHLLNDDLSIYNNLQNLNIIFENLLFRLNILLQELFFVPKPEIASISQLNYQTLAMFTPNETSGSSPGIIPSFKYIFGNWLGTIFGTFYLNLILHLLLVNSKKPLAYVLIGILLFQGVFKAPMQILLIFDLNFIGFISFLIGIIYINQESNKLKSCQTI